MMKKIILLLFLIAFYQYDGIAQNSYLKSVAFKQKSIGMDSMLRICNGFGGFGDDCTNILLPIYVNSPIYSGYIQTRCIDFVDYYLSKERKIVPYHWTSDDFRAASDAFIKCVLQEDTLDIDSTISITYLDDTLFKRMFYKVEYDCSLKCNEQINEYKMLKKVFSKDGILKSGKQKKWSHVICQLFQHGYLAIVSWCDKHISISLLDPDICNDIP